MTDETLSFKTVTEDIESKEVINLGGFIATPNRHISVNIFKSTVDIYLPYITNIINVSVEKGLFSDKLKISNFSPIFKKKDGLDKGNYRPVSVLPHVSKVFERIMFHQINIFATDKLSKQLTGFRKKSLFNFYVGIVEEDIRSGRVYLWQSS